MLHNPWWLLFFVIRCFASPHASFLAPLLPTTLEPFETRLQLHDLLNVSAFLPRWRQFSRQNLGFAADSVLSDHRIVLLPAELHPFGAFVHSSTLRVGRRGMGTRAHRDSAGTLLVVVTGQKLVSVWHANATSKKDHVLAEGDSLFLPTSALHRTLDLTDNVVSAVFRTGPTKAEEDLTELECRNINNGVPGCWKQPWEAPGSPCTYCKCSMVEDFGVCPYSGFLGYFEAGEPLECSGRFRFPSGDGPKFVASVKNDCGSGVLVGTKITWTYTVLPPIFAPPNDDEVVLVASQPAGFTKTIPSQNFSDLFTSSSIASIGNNLNEMTATFTSNKNEISLSTSGSSTCIGIASSPSPAKTCIYTGFNSGPATQITSMSDTDRKNMIVSFDSYQECIQTTYLNQFIIVESQSKTTPTFSWPSGISITVTDWGSSSKYSVSSRHDAVASSFTILKIPAPSGLPATSVLAFLMNVDRMDANAALGPNSQPMTFKVTIPAGQTLRTFLYSNGAWAEVASGTTVTLPHTSPVVGYTTSDTTTNNSNSALYGLLALLAIPVCCVVCLLGGAFLYWKDPTIFSRAPKEVVLTMEPRAVYIPQPTQPSLYMAPPCSPYLQYPQPVSVAHRYIVYSQSGSSPLMTTPV